MCITVGGAVIIGILFVYFLVLGYINGVENGTKSAYKEEIGRIQRELAHINKVDGEIRDIYRREMEQIERRLEEYHG